MLKITKGLKKKKKGKKSKKNKEEELFKPEELEAYRREHQQQQTTEPEPSSTAENDEWRKFQALTAGIDNVLRKTQGDLDRIKSTSFFQRVPPPSEVPKPVTPVELQENTEVASIPENLGVVPVSESESEDEGDEEDDIFDTSFVDAVESGEVKLAYIPESPVDDVKEGDDPFDTSIAERAILGPAFSKKGKKLVPLGAAVEVLTGRVEQVTCATRKPINRQILKQKDLLLGSFDLDNNGNTQENTVLETKTSPPKQSLLDDDSIPLEDAPIDLSGATLYQPPPPLAENLTRNFVKQFELNTQIQNAVLSEFSNEDDDEFAVLAAESLTKQSTVVSVLPQQEQAEVENSWNTFETNFEEEVEEDPFDTTFASNILPGKAELKLIENEILNATIEELEPRVSINLINPTGERESISSLDRIDESCLTSLQTIHRDLLGGSNTDLSKIDEPIAPNQQSIDDSLSDYSDPFDTSIVDQVSAPGQIELKFLEKEILGDVVIKRSISDPDFDPRESEKNEETKVIPRPDILDVHTVKSVAFALPTPNSQPDLLGTGCQETVKHTKPLTPYYVRENSIPEVPVNEIEDPFDTSFVTKLPPGKAELKILENEFIDDDFDPRASDISIPSIQLKLPLQEQPKPDLLAADNEVNAKVLTPAVELTPDFELSYCDPFDTSIASNILPGKIELKLLENELIHTHIKRNLTDPEFDPRNIIAEQEDLLNKSEEQVSVKPLTPTDYQVSFDIGAENDLDPFDTSVADNLVPGRTELKLLESELI